MQAQWLDLLNTIQGKIKTSGYQLQEIAMYGDTGGYGEIITRLSEHCDKMVRTIETLKKENTNV